MRAGERRSEFLGRSLGVEKILQPGEDEFHGPLSASARREALAELPKGEKPEGGAVGRGARGDFRDRKKVSHERENFRPAAPAAASAVQ